MPVFNQNKMIVSVTTGHTAVSSGPNDICNTPAPPAPPIPLPYPNIAMSAMMGPDYATKTMALGGPIMNKKSKIAMSNGDQPGVAGGVVSGKIMGMCEVLMSSMDVMVEGAGVVRTLDMSLSNG